MYMNQKAFAATIVALAHSSVFDVFNPLGRPDVDVFRIVFGSYVLHCAVFGQLSLFESERFASLNVMFHERVFLITHPIGGVVGNSFTF